jgi:undecaprenyl-diphosphatase
VIGITIAAILSVACILMMFLERRGLSTTLRLAIKGDLKRESRLLAQYGQLVCTFITALLIWQLDKTNGWRICESLWTAVILASIVALLMKRLLGRVRPNRENAGKFLGPTLRHANFRESFPSSHSACAVAYTVVLATAYPQAAITFWVLALICAVLRYLMDAHWPSDVLGGIALGYFAGILAWRAFA